MGTLTVAFAAKIRSLQEICTRIMNGTFPQPSPNDIAETLNYFSKTLIGILKDVPSVSYELFSVQQKDGSRFSIFPNLDYKTLYYTLVQLLEILPQIQMQSSIQTITQNLLRTLSWLIPFMEYDMIDTLPYLIATSIAVLPPTLHKDLLDFLCYNLLPLTVMNNRNFLNTNMEKKSFLSQESYLNLSIPSILLNVLFYAEHSYHSRLLETLMLFRSNIMKDLFCVIAYGTVKSKCIAVELLFQYWPQLNPSTQDRKILAEKHVTWKPMVCQNKNCTSFNEISKICFDYKLAIELNEKTPYILICINCANDLYKKVKSKNLLVDILLPIEKISYICENKSCKLPISQKMAVSICFSMECVELNSFRPVRHCDSCFRQKHGSNSNHVIHTAISSVWNVDSETQNYLVEAIISLLKEAQPVVDKQGNSIAASSNKETSNNLLISNFGGNPQSLDSNTLISINSGANQISIYAGSPTDESQEVIALEERHLLSRYGIWLITQLCTPTENTNDELLGRLLAMLFQWFHYTACLPDDQAGSALERLKGECIRRWLMEVVEKKFDTFANCLLPHPMDCSKVSGHWDCWPNSINQIKEGFKRLICLVPYDIITLEIWNYIMPFWMDCFHKEIPEEELAELKILLSKVLDPDLSPLGFTKENMYKFITIRFENTIAFNQEKTLYWIQILTLLEVPIPLKLLFNMFISGVHSMRENVNTVKIIDDRTNNYVKKFGLSPKTTPKNNFLSSLTKNLEEKANNADKDVNLNCFILMLDILIKQMEMQDIPNRKASESKDENCEKVLDLMTNILETPWSGKHLCKYKDFKSKFKSDLINNEMDVDSQKCAYCELCSIWFQLALQVFDFFCPPQEVPMTEKCFDLNSNEIQPLDIKKMDTLSNNLFKTQKLNKSTSNELDSKTLFNKKENNLNLTTSNEKINKEDLSQNEIEFQENELQDNQTSLKFVDYEKLSELPTSLKLLHLLLKNLQVHKNSDVIYHIIYLVKKLCLHSEVLTKAVKDHREYLDYAQEYLLTPTFYNLLQFECSQISQLAVPLLLHCMILPGGKTKFWSLIRKNFNSTKWNVRFTSVERVITIANFLDVKFIKNAPTLQNSLANVFAYLVQCLDDIEATVSQRTLLNLESIRTNSLKLIVNCLELQFDCVILDRPIILQTIFQLYNHLCERRFLLWDFFLNRFDGLFLEAQVCLERSNEISYTRDLKNSNIHSESYQNKLQRAQMALNFGKKSDLPSIEIFEKANQEQQSDSNPSLNKKIFKTQSETDLLEDKGTFLKQPSAPILRRKASKIVASSNIPEKFQNFPNTFYANDNQFKQQMTNEEAYLIFIVHRIFDKQEQDLETMHSLVFLLMQFLSRPDQSQAQEEKSMGRTQQIVIKHLSILLGFSPSEKQFLISPNKLRKSSVFNAVLTSLPKVLDFNHKMGNLLSSTLIAPLLIYAPSPQSFVGDYFCHPYNENINISMSNTNSSMPNYSLFMLEPHARESWLMSVQILFYKYQYTTQPLYKQIHMLIQIVINTLESQFHLQCEKYQAKLNLSSNLTSSRMHDSTAESTDLENEESRNLHSSGDEETGAFTSREISDNTSLSENEDEESVITVTKENSKKNSDIHKSNLKEQEDKGGLGSIQPKPQLIGSKFSKFFGKEEDNFENVNKSFNKIISPKHKQTLESNSKNKHDNKKKKHFQKTESIKLKHKEDTLQNVQQVKVEQDKFNEVLIEKEKRKKKSFSSDIHLNDLDKNIQIKPIPERLLPIGQQFINDNKHDNNSKNCFLNFVSLPVSERLLPIGPNNQKFLKSDSNKNLSINAQDNSIDNDSLKSIESKKLKEVPRNNDSNVSSSAINDKNDQDVSKLSLTNTTSLPLEVTKKVVSTKCNLTKSNIHEASEVNDSSSGKIKNNKEKSLSESKVDKVEKFKLNDIKKPFSSTANNATNNVVPNAQESNTTSISIDIPEEDSTVFVKDCNEQLETIKTVASSRHYKQKKSKKSNFDSNSAAANVNRKNKKSENQHNQASISTPGSSSSINESSIGGLNRSNKKTFRSQDSLNSDDNYFEKCSICNTILEEFSEHELDLCITILSTFVNREPAMSAPLLPLILSLMAKYTNCNCYSWQNEDNTHIHVPGNIRSVAKQLIRCILYNFSSNGIFQQLFTSHFANNELFKAITVALEDFPDLNVILPLVSLFEELNERKHLPHIGELILILSNVATYMECVPVELYSHSGWNSFFSVIETFLRKFSLTIQPNRIYNLAPVVRIMLQSMQLTIINNCKTILNIFTKLLSQTIQQSPLDYEHLLELCHLSCKVFAKERDRILLTRVVIFELINCLKMKVFIPDENVLILVQFLLQENSGTIVPSFVNQNLNSNMENQLQAFNTLAAECAKQYVNDLIEFINDVHSLNRIKETFLATSELKYSKETLGAQLKGGVSQYLAIEMSRGNGKDHRAVVKYLPWLYNLPPNNPTAREFLECVSHIRLLSWILLGSLQHSFLMQNSNKLATTQPIPLEANGHIAEQILEILAGFTEQNNYSVIHMTSLSHAFILCQLWTVYCENISAQNLPGSEQYQQCTLTLCDFWSKITPGVLQYICHSEKKGFQQHAERVTSHFLRLIESLMECNSNILTRLMPMWIQIFHSYQGQLSAFFKVRLDTCINWAPQLDNIKLQQGIKQVYSVNAIHMLKWTEKLQLEMAQTELQSSTATQLYSREIKRN